MKKYIKASQVSLLSLLVALIFLISCEKKEEAQKSQEENQKLAQMATESLKASSVITNSVSLALNGATEKKLKSGKFSGETGCVILTVTPADLFTYPKTLVYDFGNGCVDIDGKNKKGKFILTIGKFWETGSNIKVEYDNFYEEGVKLEGSFTLTNNSTSNGALLDLTAKNIKLTYPNASTFSYNFTQIYRQVAGNKTWEATDDIYEITGKVATVLNDGTNVNWSIITPLVKDYKCFWIQQGNTEFDIAGTKILIDYGQGACDNKGILRIGDYVQEITL